MIPKNILIVSGEPSGDLHASNLVKDLKKLRPDLEFFGLGGALSKEAGVDIPFDIAKLALTGLVEVWKNIFTVGKVYGDLIRKIDSGIVDLAILVDYPGFNLRLAKELKKRSIPVVYYISPQIWAWGSDRINIIKRCVKKIIVFFKFEEELYKKYGVGVEFVGHPLLDVVKTTSGREDIAKKYSLSQDKKTVTLLPGSRAIEIKSIFPVMIGAARILAEKLKGIQFVVAKHPDLPESLYEKEVRDSGLDIRFGGNDVYNLLSISDFAVVKSGTATLETAIIGTPHIITYKSNPITALAYYMVRKVPFIGLVNIIAGKEIAPEFIQADATPEKMATRAIEMLTDDKILASIRQELKAVTASLGSPGASERAARSVLAVLDEVPS